MSDEDRLRAEVFALRTRNEQMSRGLASLFTELERLSNMSSGPRPFEIGSEPPATNWLDRAPRIFFLNKLQTETGKFEEGLLTVKSKRAGFALFGPYVTIQPGLYHLCFFFGDSPRPSGEAAIELHSQSSGSTSSKVVQLDDIEPNSEYRLLIAVHEKAGDYEFRIRARGPVQLSLRGLSLQAALPSDLPPFVLVE